ncbi:hypothetical protein EDD86DRAFT_277656 [Gorgonomyces haynaldii]|nr:hypothetical protein EDD86DRAFT_249655 [Gorgonomyces haynaldii]KAI8905644.1 hypothetical protein EDD86DRAFT_277656 [Gorgonomyces haynaldii]
MENDFDRELNQDANSLGYVSDKFPEAMNILLRHLDVSVVDGEQPMVPPNIAFREVDDNTRNVTAIDLEWSIDMVKVISSDLRVLRTVSPEHGVLLTDSMLTISPKKAWLQPSFKYTAWTFSPRGHVFRLGTWKNQVNVFIVFKPTGVCACHRQSNIAITRIINLYKNFVEQKVMYELPEHVLNRIGWTGTKAVPASDNFARLSEVEIPLTEDCETFLYHLTATANEIDDPHFKQHTPTVFCQVYGQDVSVTHDNVHLYLQHYFDMHRINQYEMALAANIKASGPVNVTPILSVNAIKRVMHGYRPTIYTKCFTDNFANMQLNTEIDGRIYAAICASANQQARTALFQQVGDDSDAEDGGFQTRHDINAAVQLVGLQMYSNISHIIRPFKEAEPFESLPYTTSTIIPFYLRGAFSSYEQYVLDSAGDNALQHAIRAACDRSGKYRVEIVVRVKLQSQIGRLPEAAHTLAIRQIFNDGARWIDDAVVPELCFYNSSLVFPKYLGSIVQPHIRRERNLTMMDRELTRTMSPIGR